jgi:hypothetical protein
MRSAGNADTASPGFPTKAGPVIGAVRRMQWFMWLGKVCLNGWFECVFVGCGE